MSYVVFPTSNIIWRVFREKQAILGLHHLQGRIAYALYTTA